MASISAVVTSATRCGDAALSGDAARVCMLYMIRGSIDDIISYVRTPAVCFGE